MGDNININLHLLLFMNSLFTIYNFE
uniref:Uncharacterized protein n=1 Tax=Anguilla anguilla TaxID=7936 RepID=A0A0E9SA72_ANGAN